MRFTYIDAMVDPAFLVPLAVGAEDAGFDGFAIPDSIGYPEHADSTYPYTADGGREFLKDRPFIEPFTLIGALATVTTRLRFATFVLKLPMRHPVLAAKQVASAAVISGNRVDLGVGLSPWPEDYTMVDQPWRARGQRFDEQIEIVRGLTTGGFYEFHGDFYDVPSMEICPVPTAPVPILIGGHSDAALKRAARIGDGWMFAGPANGDDLFALMDRLNGFRAEYGTADRAFTVWAISYDAYTLDGVAKLKEAGVTDLIVGFRDSYQPGPDLESLETKRTAMRTYAERIIAPYRRKAG